MTLDFIPKNDNKSLYISNSGSFLAPDGYLDFYGHKAFSFADTLAHYFTYHESDTGEDNSLAGKDKEKILGELQAIRSSLVGRPLNDYDTARLKIVSMLINCYQNEDFSTGLGIRLNVLSKEGFSTAPEAMKYTGDLDARYEQYIKRGVLSIFKDLMIGHLMYDSIERKSPRTIETSAIHVYERFYNYLLMDYKLVRTQKYIYDKSSKMYIPSTEGFMYYEKEEEYKEEIRTLKLRYPNEKDRMAFFK